MLEEKLQKQLIQTGRDFMKPYRADDPNRGLFQSDQQLRKPQPLLVKEAMTEESIELPRNFEDLEKKDDLLALIRDRRSTRVYTQEDMSLLQLSFLLWATQGVKGRRGKSYATLRTVPSGGARHEFETYLMVRKVEGLQPGAYHYLPMEHRLEFLRSFDELDQTITATVSGQSWAAKANVVFYWSMVSYRAEWRYGIYSHRVALIDSGHVAQNLYLACTGIGLGTCAIASLSHETCCETFGLDGDDEFVFYCAPVGTAREEDMAAEQAFYSFVEEEGL